MSSLAKGTLHICIANFKFSHTFIKCDNLPEIDIIFWHRYPEEYFISYIWDLDKQL